MASRWSVLIFAYFDDAFDITFSPFFPVLHLTFANVFATISEEQTLNKLDTRMRKKRNIFTRCHGSIDAVFSCQ